MGKHPNNSPEQKKKWAQVNGRYYREDGPAIRMEPSNAARAAHPGKHSKLRMAALMAATLSARLR